jgi:Phosphotransferase enzyme family
MSWLPEPSPAAVAAALRVIAPALTGLPVTIPSPVGQDDPAFQMSSAALGDDFVVKFAWSQAAARFILHQITILATLALQPTVPFLPEVVAAGTSPLILVTRRVRGTSLFEAVDRIDRDHAGGQLARFLAALHSDQMRRRAEAAAGPIPAWYPLVTTAALRERFGQLVTPGSSGPSSAGATGRARSWRGLSRRCSSTGTCMATTRSGPQGNCTWSSTSRTSAWPSRSMSCAAFPAQGWVPASSC